MAGSICGEPDVAELELNHLEEVILGKVQQRTPPRMNEDVCLVKSFRYHDLANNGWCDFDKFKRAILPFVSGIADQDLHMVFSRYSAGGQALDYKQFAAEFVSGARRQLAAVGQTVDEVPEIWESPEDVLMKLKAFFCSEPPSSLIGLCTALRDADPYNTRALNYSVFAGVAAGYFEGGACALSEMQIDQIFQLFQNPHAPDMICYDELFLALKDEPGLDRRESMRAAWRRLDADSEGVAELSHIVKSFNAPRHPSVSDGSMQLDEIRHEFEDSLKSLVAFRRGQRSFPTDVIAWEEFEDYYKFVSNSIHDDGLFAAMMQRVWDLDKTPNMARAIEARENMARPAAGIPPKTRSGLHHWQSNTLPTNATHHNVAKCVNIDDILLRTRRHIAGKGFRMAVDVVKNFYGVDDDVDDLLDVYEFRRACQQSGLAFKDSEERSIFEACSQSAPGSGHKDGKIQVQRFLQLLHGDMGPTRIAAIKEAFASLGGDPSDGMSVISPAVLKESFYKEAHPLVVSGQIDAAAALSEFLDTFSLLAHVRGGCENGMVALSDFLAYYEVVSATMENDAFFEMMVRRLWNIAGAGQEALPRNSWGDVDSRPSSPDRRPLGSPDRRTARAKQEQESPSHPAAHRRYMRKDSPPDAFQAPDQPPMTASSLVGPSSITKSSIVFDDKDSSELGTVIKRLRSQLAKRGVRGWKSLGERFQQYDYRKNHTIMRLDWDRMHKSLGLGLSPEERDLLWKGLSAGRRDSAMDYSECLRMLRGGLSEFRRGLIERLFEELADGPNGTGVVAAKTLKMCFDASSTPPCLLGRRDASQAKQEFIEAVDFFVPPGAIFDSAAFEEFFTMISAIHQEDDEFRMMSTSAFGFGPKVVRGGC